jgi:hypothetical protein
MQHVWGEVRCIQGLVAKAERKGRLGRPRLGWKNNIKMDLLEVRWEERTRLIWLRVGKGGVNL